MATIARIRYRKTQYALPSGKHTGNNLRAFFGVPDDHDLYLQEPDDGDDTLIPASGESVEVLDGMKFYSVSRQIIGG